MPDHFTHCATLVRETDRDRYLAALFAPAEHRNALFALYAFDAEISRVRDLAREPMPGEIRLQWWREVVLGERAGEAAANPVAAALLETLSRYNISAERLAALIEVHRFDILNEPMPSLAEFQSYAVQTAGTIFECGAHILGGGGSSVAALSGETAQVQTLANVMMLLPRHSTRHQLFLPLDVLRQYGAKPDDIFALHATPELRAALAELRLRARRHLVHLGDARAGIPSRALPVFLPIAPLRFLLLAMERIDYEPFRPPTMTPWRRQWKLWRAARNPKRLFA